MALILSVDKHSSMQYSNIRFTFKVGNKAKVTVEM